MTLFTRAVGNKAKQTAQEGPSHALVEYKPLTLIYTLCTLVRKRRKSLGV